MTGTKRERPQLDEMLKYLRKDDTVVVWKLDRIGRSTKHLVDLVNEFGGSSPYLCVLSGLSIFLCKLPHGIYQLIYGSNRSAKYIES
jgi:hypothetical protein